MTLAICLEMPTGGASDKRLKQNVKPIKSSLHKVLALQPVTWYWKNDTKKKSLQYGFIAQEVERIFPEMVSEAKWQDGTDRKFLSVGEMTPHVVEAIKEQNEAIVETSERLVSLLAMLQEQQREIEHLRTLIKNR